MDKIKIHKITRKQGTNWNILGYRALMIMAIRDSVKDEKHIESLKKEAINFHRNLNGFEKDVMIMKFIESVENVSLEIEMEEDGNE